MKRLNTNGTCAWGGGGAPRTPGRPLLLLSREGRSWLVAEAGGRGTASVGEGLFSSVSLVGGSVLGAAPGAGPARLWGKVGEAGAEASAWTISLSSWHWPWPVSVSSRGWVTGAGSVSWLPSLCPFCLSPSLPTKVFTPTVRWSNNTEKLNAKLESPPLASAEAPPASSFPRLPAGWPELGAGEAR